MRLGFAHELGLALAIATSLAVVLLGGELPLWFWIVLVAPPLSAWLKSRRQSAPRSSGTLLGLASIAWGVSQLFVLGSQSAVLAISMSLIGILVARLLTRKTLRHDLQVIALSMVLIMAGSVLNVHMTFFAGFVLYAMTVIWALSTRQLLVGAEGQSQASQKTNGQHVARSRTDVVTASYFLVTGVVALAVLLSTSILFVIFPRVGSGNLGVPPGAKSQFPPSVSLRGLPRASAGTDDVVARVTGLTTEDFNQGLYLRGSVYDDVNLSGFAQHTPPLPAWKKDVELASTSDVKTYEVYLQPIAGQLLVSLGFVFRTRSVSGGFPNPGYKMGISGNNTRGELWAAGKLRGPFRYEVSGNVNDIRETGAFRKRSVITELEEETRTALTSVPQEEKAFLEKFAKDIVGGETNPMGIALRLSTYLRTNYTYTLAQPSGTAREPLMSFLLKDKAGHCEYFATAQVLLLRSLGIASRIVGGYQGGAWEPEGKVAVFTGKNAHAWVEWFHPEYGWITSDPTPEVSAVRMQLSGFAALKERIRRFWDDDILDYELHDQIKLLERGEDFLSTFSFSENAGALWAAAGLFALFIGILVLLALYLQRRAKRHLVHHPLTEALLLLYQVKTGELLRPDWSFRKAFPQGTLGRHEHELREIIQIYESCRYGGAVLSDTNVHQLCLKLEAIRLEVSKKKDEQRHIDR